MKSNKKFMRCTKCKKAIPVYMVTNDNIFCSKKYYLSFEARNYRNRYAK